MCSDTVNKSKISQKVLTIAAKNDIVTIRTIRD